MSAPELPFNWPWEAVKVPGAAVMIAREWLLAKEADELFTRLLAEVPFQQDSITMFGKTHKTPRLHRWYGDSGCAYVYSGMKLDPQPWNPLLESLRRRVEMYTGARFNSVLVNLYRDGNDSVDWHSDDEQELGEDPIIASVSLGEERDFLFRSSTDHSEQTKVKLPHGSLLFMYGATQANTQHSLPKRKGVKRPRINLTFRFVS